MFKLTIWTQLMIIFVGTIVALHHCYYRSSFGRNFTLWSDARDLGIEGALKSLSFIFYLMREKIKGKLFNYRRCGSFKLTSFFPFQIIIILFLWFVLVGFGCHASQKTRFAEGIKIRCSLAAFWADLAAFLNQISATFYSFSVYYLGLGNTLHFAMAFEIFFKIRVFQHPNQRFVVKHNPT